MNAKLQNHIEKLLSKKSKSASTFLWQQVGGGSINTAYKMSCDKCCFFVKINSSEVFKNGFKEEVLGLQFLKSNKALVPTVIAEGNFNNAIYLVLEWIEEGDKSELFWKNFAGQLAILHQQKNEQFGLSYHNYMGSLFQKNTFHTNFFDFFIENRLQPQLKLALDKKLLPVGLLSKFENLYKQLPTIFPSEKPCAVHGDLWSGNFICGNQHNALLIDPAVYFGHREIDLAMSTLFGGFSDLFYNEYQAIYPVEKGFNFRKDIYNLYPLLIHLNLFGTSYLGGINRILLPF